MNMGNVAGIIHKNGFDEIRSATKAENQFFSNSNPGRYLNNMYMYIEGLDIQVKKGYTCKVLNSVDDTTPATFHP